MAGEPVVRSPSPEWMGVRNLLFMRLDNIGDVIMAGPAIRAVREALPSCRITLMASPAGVQAAPLLPWVDDVLVWRVLWQDLGALSFDPPREWSLVRAISERAFDAAVILTSFSQSPYPAGLACLLARVPLRLGCSKERGAGILTNPVPPPADGAHQVERNLRLVEAAGFRVRDRRLSVSIDGKDRKRSEALLAGRGIARGSAYVLLSPFASARARTYPSGRFAEAAAGLAETTGLPVVITGSARERERTGAFVPLVGGRVVDLSGATTVPELAALVEGAALVLTNDTLTMHLADACMTPAVVLYSGTEMESQWRPRASRHRLLRVPTPCSPCYAFTCPSDLECLDIPPREVVLAGLDLLSEKKGC